MKGQPHHTHTHTHRSAQWKKPWQEKWILEKPRGALSSAQNENVFPCECEPYQRLVCDDNFHRDDVLVPEW